MARQKKDGVNINYFIRRDVKEKLDAYCEDVGQTATMATERFRSGGLIYSLKKNASKKQKKRLIWHSPTYVVK